MESIFTLQQAFTFIFLLCVIILGLIVYILNKLQVITILKKQMTYLNGALEELDHQAKLIIKSDMELKLYQEEVEDKLNKLSLLKSLIISSLHILDKNELFAQIDEKTIKDLGFKNGLILNFSDLETMINIDCGSNEIEAFKLFLRYKKDLLQSHPLLSPENELSKDLVQSLQIKDFLIAPIKVRENISAIFILCNLVTPNDIRRAEKEIFAIICMYLGQCLENIKLFEEIYHAKDELEKKVKERTNELVKSLREIEVISKLKSDFISGVSHELRTPLTSIKGFSSLLVDEKFGKLPEDAKKRLEKIDENVNKLVDMVNTLLDIARIESGKMEVKIAPCDVVRLAKDVGDLLSPQLAQKNIHLQVDMPESLIAFVDKNLLERVFINLINNAIKFTPQAGTIKIHCKKDNSSAIIAVSDTGCGIEKSNLEKIFQEFFRADNSVNREVRGTGLGLSLVKRIIDTHKERIWVESEIGKGTTFYFSLKLGEGI